MYVVFEQFTPLMWVVTGIAIGMIISWWGFRKAAEDKPERPEKDEELLSYFKKKLRDFDFQMKGLKGILLARQECISDNPLYYAQLFFEIFKDAKLFYIDLLTRVHISQGYLKDNSEELTRHLGKQDRIEQSLQNEIELGARKMNQDLLDHFIKMREEKLKKEYTATSKVSTHG
jgi:hypothetical protein